MSGEVRLERADRSQVRLEAVDLEALVSGDHRVRSIWAFVAGLDLSPLHAAVRSREGQAGRPAIDPAILVCLWLYATLENVGSARELARLTRAHVAYRWICGGVEVSYHTLSDFRVNQAEFLDALLTRSVTALMEAGVTSLEEIAQDGLRTRASAGGASFRRRPTLEQKLAAARERVERLKGEAQSDPAASSKRRAAAQARAAQEAVQRAEAALEAMKQIEKRKAARKKSGKDGDKQSPARASLTDPEARVMKMADGGFRPAYNLQIAMDTRSGAVVGVQVSNDGSDKGLIMPMVKQIKQRLGRLPDRWLADTGFASNAVAEQLAAASEHGVQAYMPIPTGFDARPAAIPPASMPRARAWRERMTGEPAKAIYKRRGLVEWVNAGMRNRGLVRLTVRGMARTRAILLWQALVHNLLCLQRNGIRTIPAAA